MPMWLCDSRAARVAVARSTPSRRAIELRDLVDARHAQPNRANSGADGRDQVGLARRAQDPDRSRRRLLERLQQHVGRALAHPVRILDDHHSEAPDRRRELRGRYQLAHLLDADDHPLGAEDAEVGMRARSHLARRRLAVVAARQQGRCECVGEVRAARSGRPGDQPGVRHRRAGVARSRRRREHLDGVGLAGQLIPHAHPVSLEQGGDALADGRRERLHGCRSRSAPGTVRARHPQAQGRRRARVRGIPAPRPRGGRSGFAP